MKYKVGKSEIHGDGVFATQPIKQGEYISDTPDYIDNVNQTIASSFHNHDEKNANVLNTEKGNQRFLIAKRGIEVGEELTADYNLTPSPPFEDPNDFKDLDERELPLSILERDQLLAEGFELEEMHEGGNIPPHNNPHDPPNYKDIITNKNDPNYKYKDYAKRYGIDLNSLSAEDLDALIKNQQEVEDYWKNQTEYNRTSHPTYWDSRATKESGNPAKFNEYAKKLSKYHTIPGDIKSLGSIGWEDIAYEGDPNQRREDYPVNLQNFIIDNTTDNVSYVPQLDTTHGTIGGKIDYSQFPLVRIDDRFPNIQGKSYYQKDEDCMFCPDVSIPQYDTKMLERLWQQKVLDDFSYEEVWGDEGPPQETVYAGKTKKLRGPGTYPWSGRNKSGRKKKQKRCNPKDPKCNQYKQRADNRLKHGGPHDPLPKEYLESHGERDDEGNYQMKGFEKAVNADLTTLLRGFNTDGYDSHWYQGNAESYGVTADQLREFAAKNHPKSFVNAAAYTQAMNKLANDAGAPNVSNIPFADNPMVIRTDADDLPIKKGYVAPQTLQEQGYVNETGTNAINQDKSYSTGLAKRYGRGMYDHLVEEQDGGPVVKQRRGVRENPDGTVSSHLMRAEYIPERGWVGFPSLFQDSKPYADDQQNWVDMSEEEDWMKIYEEAERRGEVYDFGKDKEAAIAFGEGSWKNEAIESPETWEQEIRRVEREIGHPRGWTMDDHRMMQDKLNEYKTWRERHPEVIDHSNEPNEYVVPLPPHLNADQYIELSDEEVEQYRAGGYVLEEMQEPELPKANGGGKFLANKVAPVVIEPGIKLIETFFPGLGRSAGNKIAHASMGDARYNFKDIVKNIYEKGDNMYFGQDGILSPDQGMVAGMGPNASAKSKAINEYYGEDKRDLIRQYFFGDSNNMTEAVWKSHLEGDNPLGDMIKRHGKLKAFELFSQIGAGKPINAYELAEQMNIGNESLRGSNNPLYESQTFMDATGWKPNSGHTPIDEPNVFLDNKQGLVDIYEDQFRRFGTNVLPFDVYPASTNTMGEQIKVPLRSLSYNPIKPYDDIAGHMTYLQRHGQGDYSLTSRDAWHFSPKSYNSKWYDQEGYLENLPARLMDKFGKPFILTQTNPISFDFDLFKGPTKSKLKLKKGGLVRFENGGGVDSKLKVTTTFDKEKVDELRLRHKKQEDENPDIPKVSFEEWLNYQLMDQRTENNPDAKRKFTDYMVINEDGTASIYDGEEIKNRIWKHGRRTQQLVAAGLPEGDHAFLQEHMTKATTDGEMRYMNHIKKGLNQGMTMDEIKTDMVSQDLISEAGWNKKYEGKSIKLINTRYDELLKGQKENQAKMKTLEKYSSAIDPSKMTIEQLQQDEYGNYSDILNPKPTSVKPMFYRIAGTAHMQQIPSMEGVSILDPNATTAGEKLFNQTYPVLPGGIGPSNSNSFNWENLTAEQKQSWNQKGWLQKSQTQHQGFKDFGKDYIQAKTAGAAFNKSLVENPTQQDKLDAIYNFGSGYKDYVKGIQSNVIDEFDKSQYLTVGRDAWGNQELQKTSYNSSNSLANVERSKSMYPSLHQNSGRASMFYPEMFFMGPGAGAAGLTKNLVGKGLKGLGKGLQKNPVNWASKKLIGKELPGFLKYATTPGKIIGADFAYESFKPDGMASNFIQGAQDVAAEIPGGRTKMVENSWPLLFGPSIFGAGKNLIRGINQLKGTNSLMPVASNSRFGNYGFGYTSPSGNTNILRANPDYVIGDNIKNFKPTLGLRTSFGDFGVAKYAPTTTGYSGASKNPFGFSKNFNLTTSGTSSTPTSSLSLTEGIGSPGYKSVFSNNNYLLGNSKFNNSFNSFTDTNPEFHSTFSESIANAERQKIADINNVIVNQTKQEVSDLSSPEGIRRLTLNYKNLNPNLNEEEVNHLVTTTINEVNEAGTQNVASYLAEDASFENMSTGDALSEINKAIPKGNAYFTGNPFYGDKLRGDVPSRQKGFGLDAFKRFGSDESEILGNLGESMKSGNIPTVGTSWGKPIKRLDLWSGALSSQNPIFTPGSITTGSDLADNPTIGHELGHAIARSGVTDTDIKLQQLFTDAGVKGFGQRNWNKKVIKNNPDYKNTLKYGQNYFYNPGYGNQAMSPTNKKYYDMPTEGFPMAREFRQDMLDKGFLQNKYDKITPSILESYGLSNTPSLENRAFYMSPPSKYGPFSDILNDMPSWLAPTIGTGVGVGIGLNSQKEEKDVKLKKGGFVDVELTEDEALAYAQNGYIVEAIN